MMGFKFEGRPTHIESTLNLHSRLRLASLTSNAREILSSLLRPYHALPTFEI